jgi:hypothetical protein
MNNQDSRSFWAMVLKEFKDEFFSQDKNNLGEGKVTKVDDDLYNIGMPGDRPVVIFGKKTLFTEVIKPGDDVLN